MTGNKHLTWHYFVTLHITYLALGFLEVGTLKCFISQLFNPLGKNKLCKYIYIHAKLKYRSGDSNMMLIFSRENLKESLMYDVLIMFIKASFFCMFA